MYHHRIGRVGRGSVWEEIRRQIGRTIEMEGAAAAVQLLTCAMGHVSTMMVLANVVLCDQPDVCTYMMLCGSRHNDGCQKPGTAS